MTCPKCGRRNRTEAVYCDACGAALLPAAAGEIGPSPGVPSSGSVFVGREQDLSLLHASLERSIAGEGQIVALAGEPGIGKTRLAQMLAQEAGARGVRVLWGRCREEAGAPPYWPWVQVLRECIAHCDGDRLLETFGPAASELAEIVPQLIERLPSVTLTPAPTNPAQARFRLFEAVLGSLRRAAVHAPLLFLFDDLHWADTPSLRLLEFLAPEISAARLLIVMTYRDVELTRRHPLSDTLGSLARQPNFRRVRLAGLSAAETAQFVAAASGEAPPGDLVAAVHGQTEGNPLFVVEMTRYLVEAGVLGAGRSAARPALLSERMRRIPEGIREAIGARLNRLSAVTNEVLADAAVIGRVFRLDILMRSTDSRIEPAAVLEEALAAGIIEELTEQGVFQFSHALIRETLYDEIPAIHRARLHLRVANVIEAVSSGEAMADLAALAHHHSAALPVGDAAKAVEYARKAAERATHLFAYEEAARYFRLALQSLETLPGAGTQERLRLLISEGEALTRAASWREATAILEQAAAQAKSAGVAHELARAACGFEEATWRPGLSGKAASRLLREALAALGEEESAIRVEVLSSLTRALVYSGEVEEAMRVNDAAVAMARRLGDPATLATALLAGVGARWLPERFEQRMAAASEAMQLARAAGDRELELQAASWRLFDLMELGTLGSGTPVLETYTRAADGLRQPFYQYIGLSSRSMLALLEGHLAEAEDRARQALAFGARMPTLDAAGIYGMQMFSIRREQGRLKELAPLLAHFVRSTPEGGAWRPGLALIYTELGMTDEARAEFEALAADGFAAVPRDGLWPGCLGYLAEACAFLGDADRAALLYAFLLPYAGRNLVAGPNIACAGAVERHLGMLAAVMQRWPEAVRHFEAALDSNARQGARPWLAHTRYEYAAMLLARGLPEDREFAAGLLNAAFETAHSIGMHALNERISALRDRLSAQEPPSRYPAGLSRREMEVLELIAAGKGNREIAEQLFVSPHTVANHVRSILNKTNCANRTEAAAFALRNALVRP
jgi:DNA-binding CsgD family transcriptional regulator